MVHSLAMIAISLCMIMIPLKWASAFATVAQVHKVMLLFYEMKRVHMETFLKNCSTSMVVRK